MMPPILECRNLSLYQGETRILHDISFSIGSGDRLSIIGPNGAGKSTLLKTLLRLGTARYTGEIYIKGRQIASYSQKSLARILAYAPQSIDGIPPFTVREFVNLSRYSFDPVPGANECCKIVENALERTNIAHLAERRMDTLSGGQRQRVLLAAALAQDTDMLLLDEPDAFLDPRHVHALNELLKSLLNEDGMTIATVTHDLNQPLDAGGVALVLSGGRQIYFGPVDHMVGHGVLERAFNHKFSYLVHPLTGKTVVVA